MAINNTYTKADTLRGTITEFRKGWDVFKYNLQIDVDINSKSIAGKQWNNLWRNAWVRTMQVDLQTPMTIDHIIDDKGKALQFENDNMVGL